MQNQIMLTEAENRERLDVLIDEVLQSAGEVDTLLAMDFDECVLHAHLSRQLTNYYRDRHLPSEYALTHNDVTALHELCQTYIGLSANEFYTTIANLVHGIEWKSTFKDTMYKLANYSKVFPLFITSGMKEAASTALRSVDIDVPVIGCSMSIEENSITDVYNVVTNEDKRYIATAINAKIGAQKLVTLGHSKGDIDLVSTGTSGYRLCFPDGPEIVSVSDHSLAKFSDIMQFLS